MRRFGYLHDRLFWAALGLYLINRLVVLPHLGGFFHNHVHWIWAFLHSHLDDWLLIPAALPVVLWLQKLAGLRKQDLPPGWGEMFLHLAVWSVMCKMVAPFTCISEWLTRGTFCASPAAGPPPAFGGTGRPSLFNWPGYESFPAA